MNFLDSMMRGVANDFQSLFETPQETRRRQTEQQNAAILERMNLVVASETPDQKATREKLERLPEYRKYAVAALVMTVATAIIGMIIGSLFLTLAGLFLTPAACIAVRDFHILGLRISEFDVIVPINNPNCHNAKLRTIWKYALIENDMRNHFLNKLFEETLIVPMFARPT